MLDLRMNISTCCEAEPGEGAGLDLHPSSASLKLGRYCRVAEGSYVKMPGTLYGFNPGQ